MKLDLPVAYIPKLSPNPDHPVAPWKKMPHSSRLTLLLSGISTTENHGGFTMSARIGRRELMAKARGFTASISKLTKDERTSSPSGSYGEDYNRLRGAVAELYSHLANILPPSVQIERSGGYWISFYDGKLRRD